jgi:transcriptional regulator with XRE-family HTH domain
MGNFQNMADGGRTNKDIARRLIALRESLGLNQAAFATLVGLSQPAINNYEKGIRRPDYDSCLAIKLRTGATRDWILDGDRQTLPQHLLTKLPDLSAIDRKQT